MDEYVHKRDVSKILSQLQSDLLSVKGDAEQNPKNAKDLKNKIDDLLKNADKDLRLKTQAIVRSRLAQSNVLPVTVCTPKEKKEIKSRQNTVKTQLKTNKAPVSRVQTPKIETSKYSSALKTARKEKKTISTCETNLFSRSTAISQLSQQTQSTRIHPISSPKKKTVDFRPKTQISKTRKRMIPETVKHLKHVDLHDPAAPPPPLPEDAVENYGVEKLVGIGYIKPREVSSQLEGTLFVGKYNPNINIIPDLNVQHYVLDKNPQNKDEIGEEPAEEPKTNEEEESNQENKRKSKRIELNLINGEVLQTPEFYNFKRLFATSWEQISIVLMQLKQYCEKNGFGRRQIDGNIVNELSKIDPDEISESKLNMCFIDSPDMKKRRVEFVGPNAEHMAAVRIQSVWRGYISRRIVRSLMRNNAAARLIQRWLRTMKIAAQFKEKLARERKDTISVFESTVYDGTQFNMEQTHIQVHLLDSYSSAELGRLKFLSNKYATLIFITRTPLPSDVTMFINKMTGNDANFHLFSTHFKLPENILIEHIFSMDIPMQTKVAQYAQKLPIFFFPKENTVSLIDVSKKFNGTILAASPNKVAMFQSRDSVQRLLKNAGLKTLESSENIFDGEGLTKVITNFTITFPLITTWRLRTTRGDTAWYCSNDFSLVEQLRSNFKVLDENDLHDPHFNDLLRQNVVNEIPHILETTNKTTPEKFLRDFMNFGGTVEARPLSVTAFVNAAFFVPPIGSPEIVGTWETIFSSGYEPMASIHPAFSVNREKLKKSTRKIAGQCSSKRLIGYNLVKYYYGTRVLPGAELTDEQRYKTKLVADDLILSSMEGFTPQLLVEAVTGKRFDEESMSIGPSIYTYVQTDVQLPEEVKIEELKEKLASYDFPMDAKVFLVPNLRNCSIVGLIVMESTVEKLVFLVYRVFTTMCESIFNLEGNPEAELFTYIRAISFLKNQLDRGELTTTAQTLKVKNVEAKPKHVKMFRFASIVNKVAEEQENEKVDFNFE